MIVVIIAGGSGTRLWPLSTPDYPKHLLKLNGDSMSLLQRTYERAQKLSDKIYVVSESGHIDYVKEQLTELADDHFVIEPDRRGTASCIVAALAYIAKQGADSDEPLAFMHADHYIRDKDGFAASIKLAGDISQSEKRIVLVGVEPDYPATCFGYIQKGEALKEEQAYAVHSFKEKPDFDTAKRYFESGNYLWNGGYFVGSIETFKNQMRTHSPELHEAYEKLFNATGEEYRSTYLGLKNTAIDYALMEKVPDLLVVPASFDWMDLGSFGDLHKALGGDEKGNHIYGNVQVEATTNSYIHNQSDEPLAVIGLDDVVVIHTPQGVLVARKDQSQKVGEISKRFNKP